ncbi:hypothetical protein EZV62_007840 [Acer yangbiense]|uniref:B30.2/SPRY domain-containing protein n=1 Tax=Acer yangbiense TaxID=1000413 RepID=A0A5C7IBE9_9ROSI|nr:hypothetical protein EZV62_007840 [Acer yangbiense]
MGSNNNNNNKNQDLGLYFLEMARASSSMGLEDEKEESPMELNTINSSGGFLVVSPDKLSVKYTSVNLHGHDVGVVQANKPAPVKRLVYYFEIYVKDAGAKGQIAIGFTCETFKMRRQPGFGKGHVEVYCQGFVMSDAEIKKWWEANSCGYHGDDGLLYHGQGKGETFGPTFTSNDTVGGGINYASQEFFFTKNGAVVGTLFKDIKGPLFPTIAVHSQNEELLSGDHGSVRTNFCEWGPLLQERVIIRVMLSLDRTIGVTTGLRFKSTLGKKNLLLILRQDRLLSLYLSLIVFELNDEELEKEYEAQERMKQQMTIEKISLPPNVSYGLVRSYLLHYGYEDTLNSFDLAGKSTVPPISFAQENGFDEQDIVYALNQRKTLRQLIRNGEIDAAFAKLHNWYPWIVQDDKSSTCFLLHCQKFIELVRVGALEEAVKFGRVELAKFFGLDEFENLVQDCVALLAYEKPQESSVGYLLEDSQREIVADMVNAMVLSMNPNAKDLHGCLHSYLERLLRQLTACCLERRSMNGDQGEAFRLHRVLNSGKKGKW